jgi:hypothetical protein
MSLLLVVWQSHGVLRHRPSPALLKVVEPTGVGATGILDHGPELTAQAVHDWLDEAGSTWLFIERGSAWENPYVESFHGKLRDELLNCELFATLLGGAGSKFRRR